MKDKSSFKNKQQRISKDLQDYINSLAEEVVLNNKDFDRQKKYLERYAKAESINSETIIAELSSFFSYFEEYKKSASDQLLKRIEQSAKLAFIEATLISKLLDQFSQVYALVLTEIGTKKQKIARVLSNELGITIKDAAIVVEAVSQNKKLIVSSEKSRDFYENVVVKLSLVQTKAKILSSPTTFKSNREYQTLDYFFKAVHLEKINAEARRQAQEDKANLERRREAEQQRERFEKEEHFKRINEEARRNAEEDKANRGLMLERYREFANTTIEAVVLKKKDLKSYQSKLVQKAEAAGFNSLLILRSITALIDKLKEYKQSPSNNIKTAIKQHAQNAKLNANFIGSLIDKFNALFNLLLIEVGTSKQDTARILSNKLKIDTEEAGWVVDIVHNRKSVLVCSSQPFGFCEQLKDDLSLIGAKANIIPSNNLANSNSQIIKVEDLLKKKHLEKVNAETRRQAEEDRVSLERKKNAEEQQRKLSEKEEHLKKTNEEAQLRAQEDKEKKRKKIVTLLQKLVGIVVIISFIGFFLYILGILFDGEFDPIMPYVSWAPLIFCLCLIFMGWIGEKND